MIDPTLQTGTSDTTDTLLTAALERKPPVSVPTDFAARIAAHAQTLPARAPRRAGRYGQLAAAISFAILLLAMFVVAPWTEPTFSSLGFDLELLFMAQMLGLAAWQLLRQRVRPELSF